MSHLGSVHYMVDIIKLGFTKSSLLAVLSVLIYRHSGLIPMTRIYESTIIYGFERRMTKSFMKQTADA